MAQQLLQSGAQVKEAQAHGLLRQQVYDAVCGDANQIQSSLQYLDYSKTPSIRPRYRGIAKPVFP